jgi:hypothetical protein
VKDSSKITLQDLIKGIPMKKFTAIAVAFALCIGASAQAATVTYRLYTDTLAQGVGTYKLTAQMTGADGFGIAAYGVQLVGNLSIATGSILTTNNNSLRGTDIETGVGGDPGPAGFTLLRSADDNNAATGSNAISITGSQDTTDSSAHLIRGFGIEASSAANKGLVGSFPEGNPWGNAGMFGAGEFEIARGTTVGNARGNIDFIPVPTAVTGASVFTSADGIAVAPATIERVVVPVPEPATLGMASVALMGLAALRRRK